MDNTDTIKLLQECDAGSKMAVTSIDEVLDRAQNPQIKALLSKSKEHHAQLGNKLHALLLEYSSDAKDPNPMAKGMAWIKTNWKMEMEQSDATVADLITDGCNMGIKSLHKYLNQYKMADEQSRHICNELIAIEDELLHGLKDYL